MYFLFVIVLPTVSAVVELQIGFGEGDVKVNTQNVRAAFGDFTDT